MLLPTCETTQQGGVIVAIINLNKDNIEDVLNNNKNIIIDFWASWCGPCRIFGPIFEKVSDKYKDVVFAKVNVDEEPELASQFNVRGIPMITFIKDKKITYSQSGLLFEHQLKEVIDANRQEGKDN
jgi:thioredoxin 1